MKVILLKDAKNIGRKYEIKDVSYGHALNLLIPQGIVQVATPSNIKKTEALRARESADRKVQEELLLGNLKAIENMTLKLTEKANEKGHLFAQIHKPEIVKAAKEQSRVDILPDFIDMPKPIKGVGEHEITLKVGDKTAKFKLIIEAAK